MWSDKQSAANPLPNTAKVEVPSSTPTPEVRRSGGVVEKSAAWLGPGLILKGELSGSEDVFLESTLEGPLSFGGNRVVVGRNGKVTGEVVAREVVVNGKVHGDVRAHDRIEIRKDGSIIGDLETGRLMIEDGAYLKGNIEVDRETNPVGTDLAGILARATSAIEN